MKEQLTGVEFLENQYHFNKQLSARDFKEAKKIEENQLQEHWEECERGMKESIFWNNKTKHSKTMTEVKENQIYRGSYKENPMYKGSYLCRMDNAYIKMCYWDGEEWRDMWKPTLEGSVNNWMEIPKDL
jgi:hypothetical protein